MRQFGPVSVRVACHGSDLLTQDGWYQVRMKGSHRHFRHPSKPGLVTVPGNLGKELAVGTLDSVFDQAGLKQ